MTDANATMLGFKILTPDQAGFPDACANVARLFAAREAEFHFSSEIDRPEISVPNFLSDPDGELEPAIAGNQPVTILTTWSDQLAPSLIDRGFRFRPVTWPAGPLNSGVFTREGEGRTTYIELVNEEAPEIAPSHVLLAHNEAGFAGGAITTMRDNAAWLAVMCVQPGGPNGTGSRIWDALIADLAKRGIARLDLGTQTAERFYARCGMTVTDRVLPRLRWRTGPNGRVWSDLVMMTITPSVRR